MLRIQLLLATLLIAAGYALAGVASFFLFDQFGLPTVAALVATVLLVVVRGIELFIDTATAHPQPLLPRILGLWQWLALTCWWAPPLPSVDPVAGLLAEPVRWFGPALAALVVELGLRLAAWLLGPSLQQALRADLAVAEWFARRRIELERELLDQLARDATTDARLTHRLERLRRRFDHAFPVVS